MLIMKRPSPSVAKLGVEGKKKRVNKNNPKKITLKDFFIKFFIINN
jgi:hypothetical protein